MTLSFVAHEKPTTSSMTDALRLAYFSLIYPVLFLPSYEKGVRIGFVSWFLCAPAVWIRLDIVAC